MAKAKRKERILVVDDSAATLEVLERNLKAASYRVYTATGVAQAIAVLEAKPIDLVITDYMMPKVNGLNLVRHLRENFKDTEVIMVTGYPSVAGAVEAVRSGAEEYLAKPFTGQELLSAVRRTLDKLQLRRSGAMTDDELSEMHGLIGASDTMRQVFSTINKVATSNVTVLIVGESGTGKELVTRAIHYSSERASAPFIAVNCGGIPEGLLESEMFGHVKGAFTSATESRAGFFHTADGGTVFLDEISETSLAMQVKLLRVLQNKEINMVGSSRSRQVDVRILAATNKDLLTLVKKGLFREDLFYRLNVITIAIPPLRERVEDIPLLVRHFSLKFAGELERSAPNFSDEALKALVQYDWPGNVRELQNVVQRLLVMSEGDMIDVPDLPSLMRFSAAREKEVERTLAEVEIEHIRNVLASVKDNKTKAAKILGINRKTLREKLANHDKLM